MAKSRKVKKRLRKPYRILFTICIVGFIVLALIFAGKTIKENSAPEYGGIQDNVATTEDPEETKPLEHGEDYTMDDALFTFTVLDVGQGQSIFIDYGEMEVLIDGGYPEYGKSIVKKIRDQVDGQLDYAIATHSDADHVGGLSEVYRTFKVGKTIYGNLTHEPACQIFQEDAKKASKEFVQDSDTTITLGKNATLTIYDVEDNAEDVNDDSIITLIQYGETYFFASGDAGSDVEKKLRGKLPQCDVVVAGHHGSGTSNSNLDLLQPDYFVVSAGVDNEYGHPHKEILQYADEIGAIMLGTWKSGDLAFTSDGMAVSISTDEANALTVKDAGAK